MASRYWVGGTANWDGTAGTKWATTSGGGGGAAVPGSTDDVFFDANSTGTCTRATTTPTIQSLNCTGHTGTLAFGTVDTTIGTGNATLGSGGTYTTSTGKIIFAATSGTQVVTSNGKTWPDITQSGVGGTVQLADDMNVRSGGTYTFSNGTLDFNSKGMTVPTFFSTSGATRVIAWGSPGTKTSLQCSTSYNTSTATGLAYTGTGNLLIVSSAGTVNFGLAGAVPVNLVLLPFGANAIVVNGGSGFASVLSLAVAPFVISGGISFSAAMLVVGDVRLTAASNLTLAVNSSAAGTQRTISVGGVVRAEGVTFTDIDGRINNVSGGWFARNGSADGGNNAGITFDQTATAWNVDPMPMMGVGGRLSGN